MIKLKKYNPTKIEKKWQKKWEKNPILWQAKNFSKKTKFYLLIEFPYPSGDGLHVGHVRSYTAFDIIARKKRMEGFNVLYPIGFDSFGLPTENYALKTGIHPSKITEKNIKNFRKQLKSLGLSFDWNREIITSDPNYYKWTQWIFLKLFEKGLAYKKEIPINFCPKCKIGLANEEVINGRCERCHTPVIRKNISQWVLKITNYAEKLIKDLDKVNYLNKIKIQQKNWIGRSEGVNVKFKIDNSKFEIEVFTTRIDTIFGVTGLVMAPEHPLIGELKSKIENWEEVSKYIKDSLNKSEFERSQIVKEKTGVELKGVKVINPATGEKVPVFVGDYVIGSYGGGAVMVVPAHDQRDFDFAKRHNLAIKWVIKPKDGENENKSEAYEKEGVLINSDKFNGLTSEKAREEILKWLKQKKLAKKSIHYKLRDWIFSRQHYWGEPIPLVFCPACKEKIENAKSKKEISKYHFSKGELANPGWIALSEKDLPLKLPYLKKYQPTETGASPLAKDKKWVETKCPKCGGIAYRETDTMPNWAGSNWYYLAYVLKNKNKPDFDWDKKKIKYWMPVDWYNGGMEHTTLHLLYSRFIYKFLYDIKAVPNNEPYKKRTSHGMIIGEDGRKMSKSFGNVINPDEIIKKYGADALRVYEMFIGPFDQMAYWQTNGLIGVYRFLNRIWSLQLKIKKGIKDKNLENIFQQTIKKVSEDIENLRFNTAVSAFMVLVNEFEKISFVPLEIWEKFLVIFSPFAPHLAEELWEKLGKKKSIFEEKWLKYDPKLAKKEKFILIIQINGKTRGKVEIEMDAEKEKVKEVALKEDKIKNYLAGKNIKKVIFVPNRLINFVI